MAHLAVYQIARAETYPASMYNAPEALWCNDTQMAILGVGRQDHTHLMVTEDHVTVLGHHYGLSYASMQVFDRADHQEVFEVSISGDDYENDEVKDMGWQELHDHLIQWWQ